MNTVLQNSLHAEINKRFGLSLKTIDKEETSVQDNMLHCLTYATQDFDSLAEFMYTFKLKLDLPIPPAYFDPGAQWAYVRLPKLKLKWREKARQAKMGLRDYNMLTVTWTEDGKIVLPVEDGTSCIIKPVYHVPREQRIETVLLPYGELCRTVQDDDPGIKVSGHNFLCKYPLTHYSVSINRQGIYINRKYRDKMEYVELPEQYIIVEPQEITVMDTAGNRLSIT